MTDDFLLRDRRSGFAWLGNCEMRTLRQGFDGRELTTALAVYVSLCELANDARSDSFKTTKAAVARSAGITSRTLKSTLAGLAKLGLVHVEDSNERLACALTSPEVGSEIGEQGGVVQKDTGVSSKSTGGCSPKAQGGVKLDDTFQEKNEENEETPYPQGGNVGQGALGVVAVARRPAIVGRGQHRKKVRLEEWLAVEAILDAFNEQFGTSLSTEDPETSRMLVLRIREFGLTPVLARKVIARAAMDPWWGDGPPSTVGVCFSPKTLPKLMAMPDPKPKSKLTWSQQFMNNEDRRWGRPPRFPEPLDEAQSA